MFKKIVNAASWLSLVQVMNLLSVTLLSIFVIRKSVPADVASYMYAVFVTDATMAYALLQIAQRVTLAKDDQSFRELFRFSLRFGVGNAAVAVIAVAGVALCSMAVHDPRVLWYIFWLALASLGNYFAQIIFSSCDYNFEFRAFGIGSALSSIVSLLVALLAFSFGVGVGSMVLRDVVRAACLLVFAVYSARLMIRQLAAVTPLDQSGGKAFLLFLLKRHVLKVIEVSNHRVPALVMSAGNVISLGNFGVAFQMISQIMNVMTILSDRIAYALFSRGNARQRVQYMTTVLALYAVVGTMVFIFGGAVFNFVYGPQWLESSRIFALLGIYLFSHGALVVVTNFLITEEKFTGVYVSWLSWTATFIGCVMLGLGWPIVNYYLAASVVAFVIVMLALSSRLARGRALMSA